RRQRLDRGEDAARRRLTLLGDPLDGTAAEPARELRLHEVDQRRRPTGLLRPARRRLGRALDRLGAGGLEGLPPFRGARQSLDPPAGGERLAHHLAADEPGAAEDEERAAV